MDRNFVIYGRNQDYTEHFARYLMRRKGNPFRVYCFKNGQELKKFSEDNRIDILLSDGRRELESFPADLKVMLSETPVPLGREEGRVYKYQSGERVLKEIMRLYEENCRDFQGKTSDIYMVFSPVGRSGKTVFARKLTELLGKRNRTLYITFEEASELYETSDGGNLSDALYFYKENALGTEKLSQIIRHGRGMDYIPAVRMPEDLLAISEKDIRGFVRKLAEISDYDQIIIDTDGIMSRFSGLFSMSKLIFMPVTEEKSAGRKIEFFENYLDFRAFGEIKRKIVKMLVPDEQDPGRGRSELEIFTEAVIRNYICPDASGGIL